jgi:chromosome segregation ATPase
MSTPAQVRNVDAIENFRNQLAKYEQQVQVALESLTAELHRATTWLKQDRPGFWKKQTKLAEDDVHQAKMDLERCLMFPTVSGERPSCREERAHIKKAQARLEYCHEKVERVKYWNRQISHEMLEYSGRIGQLKRMLEIELPAARARLQQIIHRLDAYQIERVPTTGESPTTLTPTKEQQSDES